MTLFALSVSWLLFTAPVLISSNLHLALFLDRAEGPLSALYEMICISWFWWNFATNAFIFFMTSEEFQAIYKLFISDIIDKVLHCLHKMRGPRRPAPSLLHSSCLCLEEGRWQTKSYCNTYNGDLSCQYVLESL